MRVSGWQVAGCSGLAEELVFRGCYKCCSHFLGHAVIARHPVRMPKHWMDKKGWWETDKDFQELERRGAEQRSKLTNWFNIELVNL